LKRVMGRIKVAKTQKFLQKNSWVFAKNSIFCGWGQQKLLFRAVSLLPEAQTMFFATSRWKSWLLSSIIWLQLSFYQFICWYFVLR
jgi:hypothetical protein